MPRFVILHHVLPEEYPKKSHWDLMLESDGVLRTWALAERPDGIKVVDFKNSIPAEQLPDHRIAYLEYEGPVSANRGNVTQWDAGEYELLEETSEIVSIRFQGQKLSGDWRLLRSPAEGADYWLFGRT